MPEIKDINDEYNDLLAGLASGSVDNNSAAPELTPTGDPTGGTPEVVDPLTEAPAVTPTEPAVETPAAKVEDPKVEETVVDEKLAVVDDWDSVPVVPEVKVPEVDTKIAEASLFAELSKAIGADIKAKEDIVKLFNETKAKTIDTQKIPAELNKAIELASKGADYLEYLKVSTVDYKNADPAQLYEDYIIDTAADANGQVDSEKVNDYLNSLPEFEKELRGKDLQKRLIAEQNRRTAEIEQDAIRAREKYDAELKSALSGLTEIDGWKVGDNHRRELFDWISSGSITRDLFYTADGHFDPAKAAKVAFRNKYYDKLDAYQKTKIRNATKREILKDITNAEIVTPPKATNAEPNKGYSIGDYIQSLEQNLGKI